MATRVANRLLVTLVLGALLLSGCGGDPDNGGGAQGGGGTSTTPVEPEDPTTAQPSAEVSCPIGDFTQPLTLEGWLATAVEACSTASGSSLLVKNIGPVLVDVTPTSTTALQQVQPAQADDFRTVVGLELSLLLPRSAGAQQVPPGGYVVADAATTALSANVNVSVTEISAAASYVSDKVVSYVESKLTSPSRAYAKSVATCATETADLWSRGQMAAAADLDLLLAETMLGPATTCGQLVKGVTAEASTRPPASGQLADELDTVGRRVRADVWDDILKLVRNGLRVALS